MDGNCGDRGTLPERAFDPFSEAYQADPAGSLSAARRDHPVFFSPLLDHWVVTRYADVRDVFRDYRRFSAANALEPITPLGERAGECLARHRFAPGPVLVNEDEPMHMRRRRELAPPLAAERVELLDGRIRELVTRYVDVFVARGRADLVDDLLWEVPAVVGLLVAGVPDEDIERARRHAIAMGLFTWGRPGEDEQVRIAEQVGQWWTLAGELIDRLKAEGGEGWVPTAIEVSRRRPDLIDDNHLQNMMMSGLVAAHETTTNATAGAVRHLLEHPDAWAAVCSDPAVVPGAVEECLRYAGSVLCWRRRALVDVSIGGTAVPAGADVLLMMGSANHDDSVFDEPERLDVFRANAHRHLTFGAGNHSCIGAPLARLEMTIVLEELSRRLPHMRLVPGQDYGYLPNASFHGPRHLRVTWDPTANPVPADRPSVARGEDAR